MNLIEGFESAWPLIGRAAELEQLSRLLETGRGAAVLAGPAGVGKTRLGSEWLTTAESKGFPTLRVAATQSSSDVPFGAFAALIPEAIAGADQLALLRQIANAVQERGGGKRIAVLVDDAHLLDEGSAALTHLLVTSQLALIVATLREGEPAPDSVVALWKDGIADRIDLQPLTADQVGELLATVLDGPVDGLTAHRFMRGSGGNALFLRELVLSAWSSGSLRREEGVWALSGKLPTSARLIEIIESRLRPLDDLSRRALGVLAMGEPLELAVLETVDQDRNLHSLERAGLIRITRDGRRLFARLPHPLYGEVLRARLSPLLARSYAAALARRLKRTGARRREDPLRLAIWTLDGSRAVDPVPMLEAARLARQRYDFPLAERLARAARDAGAGFEASLLLAQVCWLRDRGEEALGHLESLEAAVQDDRQRALLAIARIGVLDWNLKRPDEALRVAEVAEATITDVGCRDQITAERARILGRSGRSREAVELVEPLLGRTSGTVLVSACFAAGTSMAVTGQFSRAIECADRGHAAHMNLEGPPLPFGPYLHMAIKCKALLGAGWTGQAAELARNEYDRAVEDESREAQSFMSFELAAALLQQGRMSSAARVAGESAGAFRELGWRLWLRNSWTVRAHALALLGEIESARAIIAEIEVLDIPALELLGPEVLQMRAWTEVADGNLDEALDWLDQAVGMARSTGAYSLESVALYDIARLGQANRVEARLQELTEVVEGPLAEARAMHAAGLSTGSPSSLELASSGLEACGANLWAAEAAADAAVAWRRAGDPRKATAAERRSGRLASRCEGARTPALAVAAGVRARLTPRELEIATLAAQGLADKEVAARLILSRRTVENRLHTVYEKLGLESRGQLRQALDDQERK